MRLSNLPRTSAHVFSEGLRWPERRAASSLRACVHASTAGAVRPLAARCAAMAFAILYLTWKKSKVGRLAKHVVEFTGQGVAFVAGNRRLWRAARRHGTARLCKPAPACLSFSTPDTILYVRGLCHVACLQCLIFESGKEKTKEPRVSRSRIILRETAWCMPPPPRFYGLRP